MNHNIRNVYLTREQKQYFESFIANAPVAVYCHLTFQDGVGEEEAKSTLKAFTRMIGYRMKRPVEYIVAVECVYTGPRDLRIRRHMHVVLLMYSTFPLERMEEIWSAWAGDGKFVPYNLAQEGIGYMLKMRNHPNCDWQFSQNVGLFRTKPVEGSSRQRRALLRHGAAVDHISKKSL